MKNTMQFKQRNLCTMISDKNYEAIYKSSKSKIYFQFIFSFVLLFLLLFIPISSVNAATNLKLYYNQKTVNYTGQQVTYKLGAKRLNQIKYPGVIIDGTSLVSGYDVFNNPLLDLNYTYSSKTNTITFKKDYTTVKMTLGSKTAYINGEKTSMSVGPVMVKYSTTGKSKVLVPARFVAEAFGYSYSWNSAASVATLQKPNTKFLNLYYDNKWSTYQGTQGKVIIDDENVNVSSLPSIILNQSTLVQAYKVFAESSIGANYKYDAAKQTVTLTKEDNKIELTLGSKKALVNGQSKTMDEAPRIIKNKANNKSYVMVPGNFVSINLGYDYMWDSNTKTSLIGTREAVEETPDIPEIETPEEIPDGEGSFEEVKPLYLTYGLLPEMTGQLEYLKNVIVSDIMNTTTTTANILSIKQDTVVYPEKAVYIVNSNVPFGSITSQYSSDENSILVRLDSVYSENKTYVMDDGIVKDIVVSNHANETSSNLSIALNNPKAKYNIELTGNNTELRINVYYNYITELTAQNNDGSDTVTINGLYMPNPVVTVDDNFMYLDFNYTINAVGEQSGLMNGKYVSGISVFSTTGNTSRIIITKKTSDDYYISKTGDSCTVTFGTKTDTDTDIDTSKNYILKFLKPSNLTSSKISDTDLYYKNQIKITLEGNWKAFYDSNPITNTHPAISNIKVSVNSSGNTDILITTKKIQGYKITKESDYLSVKIDDPKKVYDKIVVLDAGHGGTDPGAIYGGYKEKDINFKIMYTTIKSYFDSDSSSVKAYWSRYDDTFISLSDRAAFAKKVGADLFISLHMNAASSSSAVGTEIYYASDNNKTLSNGLNSKNLAAAFIGKITQAIGTNNRGVKENKLYVCRYNTVPAILIELGFMSNTSERSKLTNSTTQMKAAKAIYDTIEYVFQQYPTGR